MAHEMRSVDSIRRIKHIVTEVLSREFRSVRIVDVRVHEDVDPEYDNILRIDVIFEGRPKDLDARKLSGAVRTLRPRLNAIHESAIPLLSFISKADDRRRRASA